MNKFLIISGIFLIIGGFAGTMYGTFSGVSQFTTDIVNSTENAERFCTEGETLVTTEGAESYSPGQGYARSVQYYCENAQGVRRDITGEFVQGIFGQFGNMFSGVSSGIPYIIAMMVGVLFVIVGSLMAMMRRINNPSRLLSPTYTINTPFGGQPTLHMPYPQQPLTRQNPYPNLPPDLALRMQQLDEAKNGLFVTPAEYEQERQRIYDELGSRGL